MDFLNFGGSLDSCFPLLKGFIFIYKYESGINLLIYFLVRKQISTVPKMFKYSVNTVQ